MVIDILLLQDVLKDLNLYRDFIIKHDIPQSIKGECNYLAALGLSTYTEVFGGFYRGDLRRGNGEKNYIAFIDEFFHDEYMDVDLRLKKDKLGGLYGAVRSGLAHEYFIKEESIVFMHSERSMNCGIIYDPKDHPKIKFVVQKYFDDFKKAFYEYYRRIQLEECLLKNFVMALNRINSSLPRSKKII